MSDSLGNNKLCQAMNSAGVVYTCRLHILFIFIKIYKAHTFTNKNAINGDVHAN